MRNNKGFAITSFLYAILVVFLIFFSLLLVNIINSKLTIDKLKNNANNMVADSFDENIMYAELTVDTKEINIIINSEINLLEGVYLKKYDGKILTSEITYESTPSFNASEIGTYTINYMTIFKGKTYTATKVINVLNYEIPEEPFEFSYSEDDEQTLIIEAPGYYKLETWGAQGGSATETYIGGYGGYSTGLIYLESGTELFINVGGSGVVTTTKTSVKIDGGYNGGGYATGSTDKYVGSGGGATHIATKSGLLSDFTEETKDNILIVSGGGGGSSTQDSGNYGIGGSGGGALGVSGVTSLTTRPSGTGGSQIVGGIGYNVEEEITGSFGQGAFNNSGPSGGGGYYGGAGGMYYAGGGGGSGYIGNSKLTDKYMYCYNCEPSDEVSTKTYSTSVDVSEIPLSDYAKKGDGYARITYVKVKPQIRVNYVQKELGGEATISIFSINNLSTINQYKYYLSTSNTELIGGEWKSYVNDESFGIINGSGRYYLWIYPVKDILGNINDDYTSIEEPYVIKEIVINSIKEYSYKGDVETLEIAASGYYKLEAWGAQGGKYSSYVPGKGAYTSGYVYLEKGETLYINVGGVGTKAAASSTFTDGGYNGGGKANYSAGTGGGATDFRYKENTLNARIMVAAGGGGTGVYSSDLKGGAGGALVGISGGGETRGGQGGTQSSGGALGTDATATKGTVGTFGIGGKGGYEAEFSQGSGAGGGGYYGGAGGSARDGGGAGGSSYISGYIGCISITSSTDTTVKCDSIIDKDCTQHYSGKVFTNGIIKAGNETMPTQDGTSTMTGNSGNGFAKIEYIGKTLSEINENTTEFVYQNGMTYLYEVENNGYYQLEAWGAQGGAYSTYVPGKGAYTSGNIYLEKGNSIYVTVGGKGSSASSTSTFKAAGYNGGGKANYSAGGGGGATDFRYESNTLNDRIMVAAGGGGTGVYSSDLKGGAGGALVGISGGGGARGGQGGTQTSGGALGTDATATKGTVGTFGTGGRGGYEAEFSQGSGAGGGGYYGGAGGSARDGGGAGGSSYISGYIGSVAITSSTDTTPKSGCTQGIIDITCSYHYSEKVFEDSIMKAGNETMPTQDGISTMTGNTGNGLAKITYLGEILKLKIKTEENVIGTDVTISITTTTDLSKDNKYKYYISTSNTELVDGSWKNYTLGESFTVSGTNGRYFLWVYPLSDINGNITDEQTDIQTPYVKQEIIITTSIEYVYSGNYEEYKVPASGYYKLEAWGAQGGKYSSYVPGNGAYTSGYVYLEKDEIIYINVGGVGTKSADTSTYTAGGYNGGGSANYQAGTGGGATDFRYAANTTNDRIMVAAGGGGTGYGTKTLTGGSGGSLIGLPGGNFSIDYQGRGMGGTQIAGGAVSSVDVGDTFTAAAKGTFGTGGKGGWYYNSEGSYESGGGGGGGYYGGSGGNGGQGGGGGGSSYISGYGGAIAITSSTDVTKKCATFTDETCSQHYSGKIFINGIMHDGTETMPTHDGTSTMTGNSGDGFARITYIGETLPEIDESTKEFAYQNGRVHIYTVPTSGYYKLEAWGAEGGKYSSYVPGKGAYTSGYVYLSKDEKLYVTVGGAGESSQNKSSYTTGGYNGGGTANYQAGTGGGATDFRYSANTTNDRIMVAAGGGGTGYGSSTLKGGSGGSLIGLHGGNYSNDYPGRGQGGTQTSGGAVSSISVDSTNVASAKGLFGSGGKGGWYNSGDIYEAGGGGGGGYYGGSGGNKGQGGGGGGSSYISGYGGAIAITSSTDTTVKCTTFTDETCSHHYSGKIFINGIMYDGTETMPTQDGTSTMTGNSGNGHAKITYIGETLPEIDESTKEFAYQNGRVHIYKVPKSGYYKLEAWGASGGQYSTYVQGKGAYTSGMIYLEKDEIIYVTVGGAGVKTIANVLYITGGYNGGGSANYQAGTGGGATDFRYASGTLNDRIMVAAGGGGTGYGSSKLKGGSGGALTGIAGGHYSSDYQGGGNGGTQIAGGALSSVSVDSSSAVGVKGTFGTGGKGGWYTSGDTIESGGGGAGGYYGGAGGNRGQGGGGGGSSYISGYKGSIAITSSTDATPKSGCTTGTTDINCSYHYSGKIFTDTEMIAGTETMPTQDGTSTMTGNTGNGFAKITYIESEDIVFTDGSPVYYDVSTGDLCTNYHVDNSLTGYNGTASTKTTDNQNSCLKFYAFNDDTGDTKINLLLDHDTTAKTVWNSSGSSAKGPKEVLTQLKLDTNLWVGTEVPEEYKVSQSTGGSYTIDYSTYKARLITVKEISEIINNTSFNENTTSGDSIYFDTKTNSVSSTCKSGNTSGCKYGWLYDRTHTSCKTYGCLNNSNSDNESYWTATSALGRTDGAWRVHYDGGIHDNGVNAGGSRGVRPVIEVLKSNLY